MTYQIKSSLDWAAIETELLHKVQRLMYKADVTSMIRNIHLSVTELSKAEVELRRGNRNKAIELLNRINNEIDLVESYILVAALIGNG